MASPSRDCSSPKQRSLVNISSSGAQQNKQIIMRSSAPLATSTDSNSSGSINLSGSPTTLSIHNNMNRGGNTSLPPIGSGPSRQRSLRDRLKDGITGSFTWQ